MISDYLEACLFAGQADRPKKLVKEAEGLAPGYPGIYHDLARLAVAQGDSALAISYVEQARDANYKDLKEMKYDDHLEPIVNLKEFKSAIRAKK